MDLPYHNSYHYNHDWSTPSASDTFPSYSSQNHYPISSCPPPSSSSSYYDYYSPSTTNTCYNTYSSFNPQHDTHQIGSSSHPNSILNSLE
jgi:hypothetical protein